MEVGSLGKEVEDLSYGFMSALLELLALLIGGPSFRCVISRLSGH